MYRYCILIVSKFTVERVSLLSRTLLDKFEVEVNMVESFMNITLIVMSTRFSYLFDLCQCNNLLNLNYIFVLY